MKILVTGASGFVGGHFIRTAVMRGHSIIATSRAHKPIDGVQGVVEWDPGAGAAPPEAFEGVDAVVHLAGESVGIGRWTKKKMARIRDSRELGTRNLVAGIAAAPQKPRVLVSSSAVGYYGDHGDLDITEATPPANDFLAEVAVAWEREALEAEKHGVRVALIRTGLALAADGGALQKMLTPFRWFVGGPIGGGKAWWAWIHIDDLVALYLWALETDGVRGPLNGTSPAPVTNREFARALGSALGRPSFLPTPWFMLRLTIGKFADYLICSQKVLPEKSLRTGFRFQFTDLPAALRSLLPPT